MQKRTYIRFASTPQAESAQAAEEEELLRPPLGHNPNSPWSAWPDAMIIPAMIPVVPGNV